MFVSKNPEIKIFYKCALALSLAKVQRTHLKTSRDSPAEVDKYRRAAHDHEIGGAKAKRQQLDNA